MDKWNNIVSFAARSGNGGIIDPQGQEVPLADFLKEGVKESDRLVEYFNYISGMAQILKENSKEYLSQSQEDRQVLESAIKRLLKDCRMVGRGLREDPVSLSDEVKKYLISCHKLAQNDLEQAMSQLRMTVPQ